LILLSPGLVLFLHASDHIGEPTGFGMLVSAAVLLAMFFWTARRKGDQALIDLRLFKAKVFSACAVTQFLSNGVMFSGQMLIPIYLIRGCGRTPAEMGWLLAPLGLGMMCTYPTMGTLTKRFGIRWVSAAGALLALVGTLPLYFLANHSLYLGVLVPALFIRGAGLSAIGLPSIAAAYASVRRQDLPMATTSLNIVQRLGGPTMTTLCATFLGWALRSEHVHHGTPTPYAQAFLLLCILHAVSLAASLRLPLQLSGSEPSLGKAGAEGRQNGLTLETKLFKKL